MMSITCLMLNADAAPVSLMPLSVISWEEAIRYIVTDKAVVLEWHDHIVRSEKWTTRMPAVMMLREYKKKQRSAVRFSKQNVFLRDGYICQYCNILVDRHTATLDHVLPVSHGGKSNWNNCTTSCGRCNSPKGNDSRIVPKVKPVKPNYYALVERRKKMKWELGHPSWSTYLEDINQS
jgi:5-methylcytosine-specific restriction endonuclease McrA